MCEAGRVSMRTDIVAVWRPLVGERYANQIANRKVAFAVAFPAMVSVWVVAAVLAVRHLIPIWLLPVFIIAAGVGLVLVVVRFAWFGRIVRRDLARHGVHVKEILYARRPQDVHEGTAAALVDSSV